MEGECHWKEVSACFLVSLFASRLVFSLRVLLAGSQSEDMFSPNVKFFRARACSLTLSSKTVREYLEKNYTDDVAKEDEECKKLAVKALLEVVESGGRNIEVATMKAGEPLKLWTDEEVDTFVTALEAEKAAAEAAAVCCVCVCMPPVPYVRAYILYASVYMYNVCKFP